MSAILAVPRPRLWPVLLSAARRACSRRSTRDLTHEEREDLVQAQLRATRPVIGGVLLCGAVVLATVALFEAVGAMPPGGLPAWLALPAAALAALCARGAGRPSPQAQRLPLSLLATLLIGVFLSMPLPGAQGQLALRTGLFQLLPLALMALSVRPGTWLALAALVVGMAQARLLVHGAPAAGGALYWLYILATLGLGLVLAGYRTDFAVSAWRMRRRLMQQAQTDGLTGLLNRGGWNERAGQAHARAGADGAPLALVLFDVDHFKRINDEHGHDGGDRVLQRFGALVQVRLDAATCAARIGGEEFAVLLEGATASAAAAFAERIREEFRHDCDGIMPTLSAGIAQQHAGESLNDLLRRADRALYAAKREGRDRLRVASI